MFNILTTIYSLFLINIVLFFDDCHFKKLHSVIFQGKYRWLFNYFFKQLDVECEGLFLAQLRVRL